MSDRPLYESFRAGFSKDIWQPVCPVIAAPAAAARIVSRDDLSLLTGECPPQNVFLTVDRGLNVVAAAGGTVCSLREALAMANRSVPVVFLTSFAAARALRDFCFEERAADLLVGADCAHREVLREAHALMPRLRMLLDCRGSAVPEKEWWIALPGQAVRCGATTVLFDRRELDRERVHLLQQRFLHVFCDDTAGEPDFYGCAALGVNGIVTRDLPAAYAALRGFPENTFLRRRNLYAHKGFQNNGKYPENSITGVTAAGRYGFDGAEIDVKYTSDYVPVVMHNTTTRGLFDCEELVTEETPYKTLSSLRRIGFPEEGIDRFEDLMCRMREYPDTPVVIEFKPRAKYHRVERMADEAGELLERPDVQKGCLGIMGALDPGLAYVHGILPELPLGYVEGKGEAPAAPGTREEAEEALYRVTGLLSGAAAGYNPEDVCVGRLFNEYAKFRGITVFVWSRSWTLSPSKWEEHGRDNDETFMAGYDGWTTDHGDMYLDLPVQIDVPAELPQSVPAGGSVQWEAEALMRDGSKKRIPAVPFVISGSLNVPGEARVMLSVKNDLHFGDSFTLFTQPFTVKIR